MPQLNLSAALTNPLTIDKFSVLRRTESVDINGLNNPVETRIPLVYGVVTAGPEDRREQTDSAQLTAKSLSIVTRFRLRATAPGVVPDYVLWPIDSNQRFVVVSVDDYSSYGPGWTQAICSSIESQDLPPNA
jgi:hypothetical protein